MAVKLQATIVETIDNQGHQGTVLNMKLIDGTQQILEINYQEDGPEKILVDGQAVVVEVIE